MLEQLDSLKAEALAVLATANDEAALEAARVNFLGKKGSLTALSAGMRDVPVDQKKEVGAKLNEVRIAITEAIESKQAALQAANDARDLDDLRQFTTPEMFAAIRLEIQERGTAAQQTDVERVDAQVIDYAAEDGRQIVSVRFQGLVREEADASAVAFDEVWHLVKPEGDVGTWAIAGIQQPQ